MSMLDLEDKGVRELRYSDGSLCMRLGARCGRCMEVAYGRTERAYHEAKRCALKPACFIVVPTETDKPEALMRARMFGHSAADADAIVKTQAEFDALSRMA